MFIVFISSVYFIYDVTKLISSLLSKNCKMKNIDKLKVLYKDNLLLVVNKLPGMLSQGGKHNVNQNYLIC